MNPEITIQQYANLYHLADVFDRQDYPQRLTEAMVWDEIRRIFNIGSAKAPRFVEVILNWWKARNKARDKDQLEPEFPFDINPTEDMRIPPGELSETLLRALNWEDETDAANGGGGEGDGTPEQDDTEMVDGDAASTEGGGVKDKVEGERERQDQSNSKGGEPVQAGVSPAVPRLSSNDRQSGNQSSSDDIYYNPGAKLLPSGIRQGSHPDHPVDETYRFGSEMLSNARPPLWRAITNFRFVNDQGQDVSVAVGQYGENTPMWVLGAVASADGGWDVGQRIMAGWWNTDEITRNRAPVEIVWMKVRVNRIWVGTPGWFRGGRTKAVLVLSSVGQYLLQAAHPRFRDRWSMCKIPVEYRFRSYNLLGPRPNWIDPDFYQELRDDYKRWRSEKKPLMPKDESSPRDNSAELESQGIRAKLIADKKAVGSQLSASIDQQEKLHQKVMEHPIPKDDRGKLSLEVWRAKKRQQDLEVQSLFAHQAHLKSSIEELDALSAMDQEPGGSLPKQYIVVPDNDADPPERSDLPEALESGPAGEGDQVATTEQDTTGPDVMMDWGMPMSSALEHMRSTATPPVDGGMAFGAVDAFSWD